MKLKIFDTEIELNDQYCGLNGSKGCDVDEHEVNLYVKMTDKCAMKCPFCEFRDNNSQERFDFYKFYYVLTELQKKVRINKVSFTGGEPLTQLASLKKALQLVKAQPQKIFTVINTQDYEFEQKLGKELELVDSVAVSVHSHVEQCNAELFGVKEKKLRPLFDVKNKDKVHITCNLVAEHIDTKDRVAAFVKEFMRRGFRDFGFVSLMKVNDFCREHFVDFKDLLLEEHPDFIKSMAWERKGGVCGCGNFLTMDTNGNVAKLYARFFRDPTACDSTLVFDKNILKKGFAGETIL